MRVRTGQGNYAGEVARTFEIVAPEESAFGSTLSVRAFAIKGDGTVVYGAICSVTASELA